MFLTFGRISFNITNQVVDYRLDAKSKVPLIFPYSVEKLPPKWNPDKIK